MNRENEVKNGLKKDIYTQIEELEDLEDNTLSSTAKLANILDGYATKIDDLEITKANDIEIVEQKDVDVEIKEEELLDDYNNQIHDFIKVSNDKVNVDNNDNLKMDKFSDLDNLTTQQEGGQDLKINEEFTQSLVSPKKIDNLKFDNIEEETKDLKKEMKKIEIIDEIFENDEKKTKKIWVDIVLLVVMILLILEVVTVIISR